FPGKPGFQGLGELTAAELESLWPLRRAVTPELASLGARGWAAVCAPEPSALESFLEEDTAPLPFLAAALQRLLEQLPDAGDGLSRSEHQLLELLADGASTPWRL